MPVVTLNPSDAYNVTRSGGNLVATSTLSSTVGEVRATLFRSALKFYFETTLTAMTVRNGVGFSTSAVGFGHASLGLVAFSVGYTGGDVHYLKRDGVETVTPSWSVAVAGDVIGCGIDLDTGLTEFFKNGVKSTTALAAAATVAYAPHILVYASPADEGQTQTVNFGATAFYAGLPAGYYPWEQVDPQPTFIKRPLQSPRPVHFIGL